METDFSDRQTAFSTCCEEDICYATPFILFCPLLYRIFTDLEIQFVMLVFVIVMNVQMFHMFRFSDEVISDLKS